jgi:transposase-like protein
MGSSKQVVPRERRAFSAEFKAEAVRLVAERRAGGASLTQIGRELEVRPDQLRAWVRAQHEAHGAGTGPTGETPQQELRRLRWEVATLRQEQAFAKKWRCTSRKSRVEVRRDCSPSGRVPCATHVSCARGVGGRLLCALPAAGELAHGDR